MAATIETIETLEEATGKYKYGFVTDIESDKAPKGLNEDIIRFISAKKEEPEWMLEWRLKAYAVWKKMESPDWAKLNIPPIDYQDAYYYTAPKTSDGPASLDEVDPELLKTYEKLGIPMLMTCLMVLMGNVIFCGPKLLTRPLLTGRLLTDSGFFKPV